MPKRKDIKDRIMQGLKEFSLIESGGSEASKEACAMTLLAWANGLEWADHPPCAHKLIADLVIKANDSGTSTEQKAELVLKGEDGVLDTWWVPTEVIVAALSRPERTLPGTAFQEAIRVLVGVAEWKSGGHERPDLQGAYLQGAYLQGADLQRAYLQRAVILPSQQKYLPSGWKMEPSGIIVRS